MKIAATLPAYGEIFNELRKKSLPRLTALIYEGGDRWLRGEYLHWEDLIHLQPPDDLSHRECWLALKRQRLPLFKKIPFRDKKDNPFKYLLIDPLPERFYEIDLKAGERIEMPEQITNPETKNRYYIGSLIEEAIMSSQHEGAATTRLVAKGMIRTKRPPSGRSERMILNNLRSKPPSLVTFAP